MKMKKQIKIGLILALVIIISLVVYSFYKFYELERCKKLPEREVKVGGSEYPRARCFSAFAVRYGSPDICEELSEKSALEICYKEVAIKLNQSELCYKILNPEQKITCLAAVTLDAKVCRQACNFILELEGFTECPMSFAKGLEEMCYMTIKNFKPKR